MSSQKIARIGVIVGIGTLAVLVFYSFTQEPASEHIAEIPGEKEGCIPTVSVGDTEFEVGLADTEESRRQGLSGRPNLAEDEGLLFIFENAGVYPFWMRDMNFPIDIIWIRDNKTVTGVAANLSPESFPQTFSPPESITYVLEVHADFDETQLTRGDTVSFFCID